MSDLEIKYEEHIDLIINILNRYGYTVCFKSNDIVEYIDLCYKNIPVLRSVKDYKNVYQEFKFYKSCLEYAINNQKEIQETLCKIYDNTKNNFTKNICKKILDEGFDTSISLIDVDNLFKINITNEQKIKDDIQNKTVTICLEDIINLSNGTLEQKEKAYLVMVGDPKGKYGYVITEDDKIAGYRLYNSRANLHTTIIYDESGVHYGS